MPELAHRLQVITRRGRWTAHQSDPHFYVRRDDWPEDQRLVVAPNVLCYQLQLLDHAIETGTGMSWGVGVPKLRGGRIQPSPGVRIQPGDDVRDVLTLLHEAMPAWLARWRREDWAQVPEARRYSIRKVLSELGIDDSTLPYTPLWAVWWRRDSAGAPWC